MLALGMLAFFVTPVVFVFVWGLIYFHRKNEMENLFQTIKTANDPEQRDIAAYAAINLLHKNRIAPAKPITINIHQSPDDFLGSPLFRAELEYLMQLINKRRQQKKYISETPSEQKR